MIFWICFFAAVVLDQAVKYLVAANLQLGQSIPLIDGILHLTFVLNKGAAFSVLQGQRWFFVLITVIVISVALWFLRTVPKHDHWLRLGLGLFCGGAIGNFIDRLLSGAVVDFVDFRIFPVFNVADCCIVMGVVLLGWRFIREEAMLSLAKRKARSAEAAEGDE